MGDHTVPGWPETHEEWQEAVDAAHAMLAIDAARQYGLVTGGLDVNVDRCIEILRLAALEGIKPSADSIERVVRQLADQHI